MSKPPSPLTVALQQIYGPRDAWPLAVAASCAQLAILEELARDVYEPALACAVDAIYAEATEPTRWDFLGWQRGRAFERRFGLDRSPEVDLAWSVLRTVRDLLGPQGYQRVISAAWEADRFRELRTASS